MSRHRETRNHQKQNGVEYPAVMARSAAPQRQKDHEEIARVAYQRWEQQGRPEGSAEQDWYFAEEQLRGQ